MHFFKKHNRTIGGVCIYLFLYTPFSQSIRNDLKQSKPIESTIKEGDIVPDFKFTSTEGIEYDSQKLKEKAIILFFWEMNSIPSIVNLIKLNAAYPKMDTSRVEVIGICTDAIDKDISIFLKKQHITLPIVKDMHLAKRIGVLRFPARVLVGKKGKATIWEIPSVGDSYEFLFIKPE